MRLVILTLVLALAACDRDPPPKTVAEKVPLTPSTGAEATPANLTDFSKPMIARGNEPFWAVKMEGTRFTLSRPDHPDAVFEAPGVRAQPGQGKWEAKSADGRAMTVTLYVSECSDGMSDMAYPMTAEVALAGETLRGCAIKLSDLPKSPAG